MAVKGIHASLLTAISSSVPFCSVFLFVFQCHGHFRRDQDIWSETYNHKERRSGILPLYIKKLTSAAVTMEVSGCHFYDTHHFLGAD